jgi:hypothetical protein
MELEGYQLIVTFFIDVVQLKLLLEKELTEFFKNTTNGKLILSELSKTSTNHSKNVKINKWIEKNFYGPTDHLKDLILGCEWRFELFICSLQLWSNRKLTPTCTKLIIKV